MVERGGVLLNGRPVLRLPKGNLATHKRGRLTACSALPTPRMTSPAGELLTGVQLCREIRFPEQWHCLARQGHRC